MNISINNEDLNVFSQLQEDDTCPEICDLDGLKGFSFPDVKYHTSQIWLQILLQWVGV